MKSSKHASMTSLTAALEAHTIGLGDTSGGIEHELVIGFTTGDPLAITFAWAGVTWPVARDVVEKGLRSKAGDGDVHVFTSPHEADVVCVRFLGETPQGQPNGAVTFLKKSHVEVFLAATAHHAFEASSEDALGFALERELLDILDEGSVDVDLTDD
jgi:hypothetical protein